MSQADEPTKSLNPAIPQSQIDKPPTATPDADATLGTPSTDSTPTRPAETDFGSIGRYRLLRKLGEGGMGQVWLAEQTAPVRRQVALKLIKAGMYDSSVLQRFQSERQSLAIMDHPSIATVFDAGATPDGQPYFVMEYVAGLPITTYCDQNHLKIRERLELFIKVCEGVQHAHQKAIIHRDLKPANILVVEIDGKPTPRIIDFGLAKAASPQPAGETMLTQVGGLVGTPGYMSPEQGDPSVEDVDTRTDVYSLGVVLYVLLSGSPPFNTKRWKKQPLYEVLRQLREEDPPRPSTKLGMEKDSAVATAEARGTDSGQLVRLLHGDLDWITMKALEKDRTRRYGTPSELAADIERYLHNEPITARPASTGYRLAKYVRRHRVGVAIASSLALLLVAVAVAQMVELRRITRERDRADRIAQFMTGMFKVSDPSEARGNSITAREILDKASKDIDNQLTRDPELQAQMMAVMGKVYRELGLYSRAQSLLERAWEIRTRDLGSENPETLKYATDLAWTMMQEGKYGEAEKIGRQALDTSRHALGPEHPITISLMIDLTYILYEQGEDPEAEKIGQETVSTSRRVLGPEDPNTLAAMGNLASVLDREGRYAESEKINREILDIRRRVLGPENPQTLVVMNNLAAVLGEEGQYSEAEKINRETFEIRGRVLGPEHPLTLTSMSNLADVLGDDGQYAEAEKIDRETLEIRGRVLGPEHPETLTSIDNLAYVLYHEDHYAEAEKLAQQAADTRRRVLGPDHPETALSTYTLACIALRRGQRDRALSMLRHSVEHGLAPNTALGMEKDPDLQSLHGDPRFARIIADAKERAADAQESRTRSGTEKR